MLIWLVFGFAIHSGWSAAAPYGVWGNSLLLFILLLLLGWSTFGAPIK